MLYVFFCNTTKTIWSKFPQGTQASHAAPRKAPHEAHMWGRQVGRRGRGGSEVLGHTLESTGGYLAAEKTPGKNILKKKKNISIEMMVVGKYSSEKKKKKT